MIGALSGDNRISHSIARGGSSTTVPLADRHAETWICQFTPRLVHEQEQEQEQEIFIRPKNNKTEYSTQKPYNILHLCRHEKTKW